MCELCTIGALGLAGVVVKFVADTRRKTGRVTDDPPKSLENEKRVTESNAEDPPVCN